MVFEDKFDDAGIKINFHGAAPLDYSQDNWWKNEEGMIMTNNELVKILYYAIKYWSTILWSLQKNSSVS